MPVLLETALNGRDASPGRTFSIIFAVVAFLVVLGCLILVVILPKVRKKAANLPGSHYPVVPNYPHPFGPPARFPSHPAMLRGFRTQPACPPQSYDPRVESPFPDSATQLNRLSSHGKGAIGVLFTPTHSYTTPRRHQRRRSLHQSGVAGRSGAQDPREFVAFNTKHDYILPVPEPLVLKPRPAGRPPPLTRQLARFPMPHPSKSSRSEGLVHPAKLFQELEQRHSDTTAETLETPCPAPHKSKQPATVEMSLMGIDSSITEPTRDRREEICKFVETTNNARLRQALSTPQLQRSASEYIEVPKKVNGSKQSRLERMGTLTRPKTPVAEIRNWFDRAASDATKEKSSSSHRLHTPASTPFTTPGPTSTPATSPGPSIDKKPLPSTPPQPNTVLPYMDLPSHKHRRTPSSVILPPAESLTALPLATSSKRAQRAARVSPQGKIFKKRSNTRRLRLVSWSKLRPNVRLSHRYSASSLSTVSKPILGPRSHYSQGASSVYSRDARRLSFLEAIDLPAKATVNHEAEPAWTRDMSSFAPRNVLPHKPSASIDCLKTKIDNWDLHTGNIDRCMSPPSAVKRSTSDTGPRRATLQASNTPGLELIARDKSIPVIQIGRSSDDVFGIEADGFRSDRANILMKAPAGTSAVQVLGGLQPGTAPGGGDWI